MGDYDAKQMAFVVESRRFDDERRRFGRWFSGQQWTFNIGPGTGSRNLTTLTHKKSKTKFEDLSEEHTFFQEFVRRLKTEKFNMGTQIDELGRLIRKQLETKRSLEEREDKVQRQHRRNKALENKIKKMGNNSFALTEAEAKQLRVRARKAGQELRRAKRDLKEVNEDFAEKEKDIKEKRQLLVTGQAD